MTTGRSAGPAAGDAAPAGRGEPGACEGLTFVLDTNIALDLWLFDDPTVQPLREALAAGAVWLGTPAMREELARVLAYPHLAARLAGRLAGRSATGFAAGLAGRLPQRAQGGASPTATPQPATQAPVPQPATPQAPAPQPATAQAAADVLAAWDAAVTLRPVAPKARFTCTDADDQKFIDLAAAHAAMPPGHGPGVVLVSKDKAVLRLKKRLSTLGVEVVRHWSPPTTTPAARSCSTARPLT